MTVTSNYPSLASGAVQPPPLSPGFLPQSLHFCTWHSLELGSVLSHLKHHPLNWFNFLMYFPPFFFMPVKVTKSIVCNCFLTITVSEVVQALWGVSLSFCNEKITKLCFVQHGNLSFIHTFNSQWRQIHNIIAVYIICTVTVNLNDRPQISALLLSSVLLSCFMQMRFNFIDDVISLYEEG